MPAFDPVRDAVLNSPITQSHSLPSRIHIELPSISPLSNPSPTSSESARSSPLTRRATDLSVLLNSDPQIDPHSVSSSLFTPTTPRAPTNLSHLLHPDSPQYPLEDQLSHASPLRRKSSSTTDQRESESPSYFPAPAEFRSSHSLDLPGGFPLDMRQSPSSARPHTPSSLAFPSSARPQTSSPLSFPTSSQSLAQLPSRPSASPPMPKRVPPNRAASPVQMPPPPVPAALPTPARSPVPPRTQTPPFTQASSSSSLPPRPPPASNTLPPKPSTLPYNPRNRITPPASVLVPLSPAELEWYKNYPGGIGTQLLRSSKELKRKARDADVDTDDGRPSKKSRDVGLVVGHYNARPEVGVVQRNESPIIGLKNFNNWVKSVLITSYAHPILAASPNAGPYHQPERFGARPMREPRNAPRGAGKVLDMGCGKGGDLTKWAKARIKEYVGIDIAAISVDQARERYTSLRAPKFSAAFAAADCYSSPLSSSLPPSMAQSVLPPNAQPFDVVSMQFCMHYAFESEVKARTMLSNVSKWLRPGGVFLGTIPNAAQLLERLDALPEDAEDASFGNSVYKIRFEDRKDRPVYGHRYWFYLKDAVDDVPEYLVHWDEFVKTAEEYDLHPIYVKEFHEVFADNQEHADFGPLLERMKVVDSNGESHMDEDQWEAANIYLAFAFEKH